MKQPVNVYTDKAPTQLSKTNSNGCDTTRKDVKCSKSVPLVRQRG